MPKHTQTLDKLWWPKATINRVSGADDTPRLKKTQGEEGRVVDIKTASLCLCEVDALLPRKACLLGRVCVRVRLRTGRLPSRRLQL